MGHLHRTIEGYDLILAIAFGNIQRIIGCVEQVIGAAGKIWIDSQARVCLSNYLKR